MTKFYIIIPTYNRANLLLRAIDSVLKQKYDNYHIYIIDDGSTDNTEKVVQKYLEKHPNEITYKYKSNGGVGSARNLGIELALQDSKNPKNDWIIFLDSDDELSENALEEIKNEINKLSKAELIIFSVINEKGKIVCEQCKTGEVTYEEILKGCIKGECFSIGKLKIVKEYKFPQDVNGGESIMWWQIFKNYLIFASNKIVRIYHQDNEGLTRTNHLNLSKYQIENQIKILEKNIYLFEKDLLIIGSKKQVGTWYMVLGRMYNLIGEKKKGLKIFLKGLKLNLFDIRRIGAFLLSFLK